MGSPVDWIVWPCLLDKVCGVAGDPITVSKAAQGLNSIGKAQFGPQTRPVPLI